MPIPPPAVSAVEVEAGLRMEMYIQSARIQRYLEETGRLPDDLDELGEESSGLQYMAISNTAFRLSGSAAGVSVSYRSTTPSAELLADAMDIVSGFGGGPR